MNGKISAELRYKDTMKKPTDIRDSIPRLQQLVPHMRDQLSGLREGATFEQARLRYGATVNRLVAQAMAFV